jgi:hypothetical protein
VTPHEREWTAVPPRLESRHAWVELARAIDLYAPVYVLEGGRLGQPPTWRAVLQGCRCEQPTCPKAGKVRGYTGPLGYADGADHRRFFGRAHPDGCRDRRVCHRGVDGYNPADAVAVAKRALATWRPVKAPTLPSGEQLTFIPDVPIGQEAF